MWRKGNPHELLLGMDIGAATMENSMEFPQILKNGTALWPSDSTSGYPQTPKNLIWKDMCTIMFIAALFTTAKIEKEPKCPSVDDG